MKVKGLTPGPGTLQTYSEYDTTNEQAKKYSKDKDYDILPFFASYLVSFSTPLNTQILLVFIR